ncbi:DUF6777 domain-containing protein [Streptacidiphilus sp. N1-3]|uniref:DUF6777 domain-containing protein n=1 Tax=Streptacidiphilus alkalitolerans TaxID=3342712 RepID=A0ABV6X1D3_9ACTN
MSPQSPADPPTGSSPSGSPRPPGRHRAPPSRGPRPPWWRRRSLLAFIAGAATAALVLGLVLATTRHSKPETPAAQQVALQPVDTQGPDPFVPSRPKPPSKPKSTSEVPGSRSGTRSGAVPVAAHGTSQVQGSTRGLYAGTQQLSSCDTAQLSSYLGSHPDQARAWAGAQGIAPSSIGSYLRTLTPVVLRLDTRVTNHGYAGGVATTFQSVLQTGTAVLIDSHGLPRMRCACGNPLLAPSSTKAAYTGPAWTSFQAASVVVVVPSVTRVTAVVLFDSRHRSWFERPVGSSGHTDHRVQPPPTATQLTPWTPSAAATPSTRVPPPTRTHTHTATPTHTPTTTVHPAPALRTPTPSATTATPTPTPTATPPPSSPPTPSSPPSSTTTPGTESPTELTPLP